MKVIHVVHEGITFSQYSNEELIEKGVPSGLVRKACAEQLSSLIDTAAGNARAAFVSPGSYIDQEYLLAKQEAQAWLDGDQDEAKIPSSVQDHMALFEVSADTAAQAIISTAEQWETALREIRNLRLGGKAAVQRAETIEAAEDAANLAIKQLNQYRPPEGSQ